MTKESFEAWYTGQHKQKWETYTSMADAKHRQAEGEYHAQFGTLISLLYSFGDEGARH